MTSVQSALQAVITGLDPVISATGTNQASETEWREQGRTNRFCICDRDPRIKSGGDETLFVSGAVQP